MQPIALAANQPADRFYRGGERIAAFRRAGGADAFTPEDWIGSTTSLFGQHPLGLSRLPDGRTLREAIEADPIAWLGAEHVTAYGSDPMLLVKLLDAGQRLPVHAHPDDTFARAMLGSAHGKAEAWYILEPGAVFLGLRHEVERSTLARLVETQDVAQLTSLLNRVEVQPGDSVFVPAGALHAIDEGVLLLEVQQPSDLSILLEWDGFEIDGRTHGHLGLGFDSALDAVDRSAMEITELESLTLRHRPSAPGDAVSVLPPSADPFFRLERHVAPSETGPGFAIMVITSGEVNAAGTAYPAGSTLLLPYGAGAVRFDGNGEFLVARPPRHDARGGTLG